MKKITLSLFASLGLFAVGFSQANISLLAPPVNGSSPFRAPGGSSTQAGMSACYIVLPSELTSLTVGTISTVGFSLTNGTGSTPVIGSFTLYLQNTTDVTYNKGLNWPTIIPGMTSAFVGSITIPATTGTAVIIMPVNFPYTGSGLYVGFDWQSAGPFSANSATYAANGSLTSGNGGGATIESPTLPTPTTLGISNFRPSFIFNGANTATNEISVIGVEAAGRVPILNGATQAPVAYVKNASGITKTNIVVSLNVGGANTFADTKTITSLASGAVGSVTFNAFPTASTGVTNLSVTVPADQVPANNLATWTQSVNCTDVGYSPPIAAINYSASGYGFGPNATTGGIYSFLYSTTNGGSVTAVRTMVPSFNQNIGKKMFAVLMDNTGNIIATGNTVTINAANFNTFMNLPFSSPQDLSAATDYFIGLRILAGDTYPIGYLPAPIPITRYFTSPDVGGVVNPVNFGYLAFEASFIFPQTVITALSTKPVICQGESVSLTASGATTYTWSANTGSAGVNAPNIIVTPTNTGSTVYVVSGTDGPSRCRTNAVSISQSVSICTGIFVNQSELSGIKVFPNPAVNGKSEISGLSGLNTITVYNLLGQVVSTQQCDKENIAIDLSAQPNGAYLVKILDANKDTRIIKIVNQN